MHTITRINEYIFDFKREIEDMEFEIKYGTKRLNAAKKYKKALEEFGATINKFDAQRLRTEYDKEINSNE